MVPQQLMARVDGLPAVLLDREQVWPSNAGSANGRKAPKAVSARQRRRIARRTAGVHDARTPRSAAALAAMEAQELRLEIRSELAEAGLL